MSKRSQKRTQRQVQEEAVQSIVRSKTRAKKTAAPEGATALDIDLPTAEGLGIPRGKTGRLDPRKLPCLFSGESKIRPTARFYPGNDARLTSHLVKVQAGQASIEDVRPEALAFLQEPEGVAGFRIENGYLIRTHKTAGRKPTNANEEMVEDEEELVEA